MAATADNSEESGPFTTLSLSIQRHDTGSVRFRSRLYEVGIGWLVHNAGLLNPATSQAYELVVPEASSTFTPHLLVCHEPISAADTTHCQQVLRKPLDAEAFELGARLDESMRMWVIGTEYDANALYEELIPAVLASKQ